MEEKISKIKARQLFETKLPDTFQLGTFQGLSPIHAFLFGEIYEFARSSFRFAPVIYLEAALKPINEMPQPTFDEMIEKYVEIKVLLKAALTEQIDDREVYMKGIDASYH